MSNKLIKTENKKLDDKKAGLKEFLMDSEEDSEKESSQIRAKINTFGRYFGVLMTAALFIWYCMHPSYYGDGRYRAIFMIRRTYLVVLASLFIGVLCFKKNRLNDRVNYILSLVWAVAAPFAIYFSLFYMNARKYHINFFQLNSIAVVFTFWFLFLMLLILLVITGSIRMSVVTLAVLIGLIGIANRFVIMFRGMALSGADLFSLSAAATVATSYKYQIIWDIYAEFYLTFVICVISLKLRGTRLLRWKPRAILLLIWVLFAGTFYHICCKTSYLEDNDIRTWGFTHQLRYKQYDMLFTTLLTCFYLAVDKPEGYSIDKVYEIAEPFIPEGDSVTALTEEGVVQPNIIVIMNESLADYSDIGNGLDFSEDPMPFIHSLTEDTIKGTAYVSIFGANTPNSEYEFLTGNTMGFLPPTSVGFNLFVRGKMPSLASEMGSLGYYNLAMHPYRGTNYRRNIVYPQIGFDRFYSRTSFFNPIMIRKYISDQSLVNRIENEYQRVVDMGQPIFSYNVSMQNHGGYTAANTENLSNHIKVFTEWINTTEAQQYANLVRATDDAFKDLIEYYRQVEEPTIILMFGDHQPNIGDNTYLHLIGNEENLTPEELMEKYKVPFICWANYDIPEERIERTSLNYLYSILADRLDLPMTGYQKYLLNMSQEIPVLAAGGYWTSDGSFYELKDKTSPYYEMINDYNILEYNYIFGKKNRCLELFELQS